MLYAYIGTKMILRFCEMGMFFDVFIVVLGLKML